MLRSMLTLIFLVWAVACTAFGVGLARRAPAVTLGMVGAVVGAVAGSLIANVDGPDEVPAYAAVGASIGLAVNGSVGLLVAPGRGTSRTLRRTAIAVMLATPVAAAGLTFLLQVACPLYVRGVRSGYCNYKGVDLLGGWISGVIVAFVADAVFVLALLLISAVQAARAENARAVAAPEPAIRPA
jgi:hypothetical protein